MVNGNSSPYPPITHPTRKRCGDKTWWLRASLAPCSISGTNCQFYSPEDAWVKLLGANTRLAEEDVLAVFSQLRPVPSTDFLTRDKGEWSGSGLNTRHPGYDEAVKMKWVGKTFHSTENVDPIIVHDEAGERAMVKDWGHARVSHHFFLLPSTCMRFIAVR